MRTALLLLLASAPAFAQTADEKAATLKFVASLRDPATGAYKVTAAGKPSLRACNGAVKAIPCLGGQLDDKEKVAAFVLSCHDPATGAFAEPGGTPDVAITSVGVMAAVELGVPREKFAKAMDYLKANAKSFEEVRIAAAAVEAWGVKDCPFDLKPWHDAVDEAWMRTSPMEPRGGNGSGRAYGSVVAFHLRLGRAVPGAGDWLRATQGSDGAWGQAKTSDLESTYRVMRAFHLLKEQPKDPVAVRGFIAKCRNADGGYGVKPGEASTMSGVYYAAIVAKWLDEGK